MLRKNSTAIDVPEGSFRECVNIIKTPNGRLAPISFNYFSPAPNDSDTTMRKPLLITKYKEGAFLLQARRVSSNWRSYLSYLKYTPTGGVTNTHITKPVNNYIDLTKYNFYTDPNCFSHAEVNGCLYFNKIVNRPESSTEVAGVTDSAVYKFDGVKVHRAGLPNPWTHHVPSIFLGIEVRARLVYITPDFSGGMTVSDYSEYTVELDYASTTYSLGMGQPDFVGVQGGTGIKEGTYPKSRMVNNKMDANFQYMGANVPSDLPIKRIILNGAPSLSGDFILVSKDPADNIVAEAGDWLIANFMMFKFSPTVGATYFLRGDRYDAFAFQFSEVQDNPTHWKFNVVCKAYSTETLMWEDLKLATGGVPTFDTSVEYKTTITVTGSDFTFQDWLEMMFFLPLVQTFIATYYYSDTYKEFILDRILPFTYDDYTIGFNSSIIWDAVNKNTNDTYRPILGNITFLFSDWYDTIVKKTMFPPLTGITKYKNLLVGFDDNAIYFSHVGLGGSIDMTSGVDNYVPRGSEFGKIVAVCGSEDFLYIARENKNYVVTGDLVDGQFYENESTLPIQGALNQKSAINISNNQVVFVNQKGVWMISAEGGVREISTSITDLFNRRIPMPVGVTSYARYITPSSPEQMKYDLYYNAKEGLLYFLISKAGLDWPVGSIPFDLFTEERRILALDVRSGGWSEIRLKSLTDSLFFQGPKGTTFVIGSFLSSFIEGYRGGYGTYQELTFDWMDVGSPAVDKKLNQIKLYGPMEEPQNIKVEHFVDWNTATPITNTYLTKETSKTYQREKKLNPSVGKVYSLKLSTKDGEINLDGIDLEGSLVQEGIKSTRRKHQ